MLSALTAANYFLCQADQDAGDLISNLKLQKLLYYAAGFHLAVFDHALLSEPIKAWEHGPVVPDVYHAYKHCGSNAIPYPENPDFSHISAETQDLLDEVYGQFSAWKLRNMTHEEPPWRETSSGEVISTEKMRAYFKTQLSS